MGILRGGNDDLMPEQFPCSVWLRAFKRVTQTACHMLFVTPREINALVKRAVKNLIKGLGSSECWTDLLCSLINVDRLDAFSLSTSRFLVLSAGGPTTHRSTLPLDAQAANMWESPPNSSALTLLSHPYVSPKGKGCAHTHTHANKIPPCPKFPITNSEANVCKPEHGRKISANQKVKYGT